MVAMFKTGDVRDLEAVLHPDYLDHQGLGGQPLRGRDGFTTVVTAARRGCAVLDVTVEDLIEQADRAAARLRWVCVRATGESAERTTLEMVRIQDGLAIEHWGGRSD